MWILIAQAPLPDMPYWSGRRWLAAADAVGWPLFWVVAIAHAPRPVGIMGPGLIAFAVLVGLARLHRAIWMNERYRFTTWRWARIAAALMLTGLVLKIALLAWG